MTLVYLAGPLSPCEKFTIEDNVNAALETFLRLTRAGVHAFCPHICALVPGAFDIPYERWLAMDLALLERCETVLMLPRWETSPGARREHELATLMGKRVVYDCQELL